MLILVILAPFALANKEQSSKLADFEGHTYEKVDTPMTWQEASSFAKEKHGTLVKVDSFQENKFLRLLMSAASTAAEDGGGSVYFWLGGTDLPSEGTWRWHDGSMIKPSEITAYPFWRTVLSPNSGIYFNPHSICSICGHNAEFNHLDSSLSSFNHDSHDHFDNICGWLD